MLRGCTSERLSCARCVGQDSTVAPPLITRAACARVRVELQLPRNGPVHTNASRAARAAAAAHARDDPRRCTYAEALPQAPSRLPQNRRRIPSHGRTPRLVRVTPADALHLLDSERRAGGTTSALPLELPTKLRRMGRQKYTRTIHMIATAIKASLADADENTTTMMSGTIATITFASHMMPSLLPAGWSKLQLLVMSP
jgi:hypothetical protein